MPTWQFYVSIDVLYDVLRNGHVATNIFAFFGYYGHVLAQSAQLCLVNTVASLRSTRHP